MVMDYYQGVVSEYLVKNKTVFINPEYELALNPEQKLHPKGTSWIIDILAIDFQKKSIFLCEVTYSKSQYALLHKLTEWAKMWPHITSAIYRQTKAPADWNISPHVFLPERFRETFGFKAKIYWNDLQITSLEDVTPWVDNSRPNTSA